MKGNSFQLKKWKELSKTYRIYFVGQKETPTSNHVCSKCGRRAKASDKFCSECGGEIVLEEKKEEQ